MVTVSSRSGGLPAKISDPRVGRPAGVLSDPAPSRLSSVSDQRQPDPEQSRAPGAPLPYAPPASPNAPAAPPPSADDESAPLDNVLPSWTALAPTPPARTGLTRLRRLPAATKAALAGGAAIVLCVGVFAVAAVVGDSQAAQTRPEPAFVAPTGTSADTPLPTTTDQAGSSSPFDAALAGTSPAPSTQLIETRTVTETERIPFTETTVPDPSLPAGTRKVRTAGVAGVRTTVYEVTLTDGRETAKRIVRQTVSTAPVTQVVAVGTREQQCDPNYAGACVPIANDVDCLGAGKGPVFVQGPVQVVGTDIYRLDRNHNGIGCDE